MRKEEDNRIEGDVNVGNLFFKGWHLFGCTKINTFKKFLDGHHPSPHVSISLSELDIASTVQFSSVYKVFK